MSDVPPFSRGNAHYHIRWAGNRLNIKRFDTQHEAELHGEKSAHEGELFRVEEFDGSCRACRLDFFSDPVGKAAGMD
jgi:hypothetical protein